MSLNIQKIPVFVFPNSLKFYLSTKSTHKQLLTLYNPYDFPVRFKVLSTSPNKYAVIDPEGSIGPQMLVDIVIRHTAPIISNCNVVDKFRISMQDHATKQDTASDKFDKLHFVDSDRISLCDNYAVTNSRRNAEAV
uniref:Motile sperm domain-containing protein 1-like n=1 Tax=Diabrotica virgifera virgifera TaxID=50390 RepID=A0A6P7FDF2_DIAVI